jgi:hypothetical protein
VPTQFDGDKVRLAGQRPANQRRPRKPSTEKAVDQQNRRAIGGPPGLRGDEDAIGAGDADALPETA